VIQARRLPAFGRDLLAQRRARQWVPEVVLLFGDVWKMPAGSAVTGAWLPGTARIALKPEDFAPDRFDWACVARLPVEAWLIPDDEASRAAFEAMVGEISDVAAVVWLVGWADEPFTASRAAHRLRRGLGRWPTWWSDEREARAAAAYARYNAQLDAWLASVGVAA
jgi:hypothetical protein